MTETDFFTFASESSLTRTVSLVISTIVVALFPAFLVLVIKYERSLHRRTILNYLACDFCAVFVFAFVVVQTIETVRFTIGPLPHVLCYLQTVLRGGCVYSFYLIVNSQAIMKYVLIFIWKSPFGFQDDFWYFFIRLLVILAVCTIQFVMEFIRRFRTLEFYICVGMVPDSGPVARYINYALVISTIVIQFGVRMRTSIYNKSNSRVLSKREMRITDIETESVLNFLSTISAGSVLSIASILFMYLSRVNPEDLNNSPNVQLLYWRSFGVPPFSATLFCIFTLKNRRFRNHFGNLLTSFFDLLKITLKIKSVS